MKKTLKGKDNADSRISAELSTEDKSDDPSLR